MEQILFRRGAPLNKKSAEKHPFDHHLLGGAGAGTGEDRPDMGRGGSDPGGAEAPVPRVRHRIRAQPALHLLFRLYHGGLAGRKLDRFSRPLAVLSAYVALVVVVTALFSFVLPQVADSIRLFVSSLSGYMANLQALADEVFALFDREGVDFSSLNEYLRRVLEGVLNTATNAASPMCWSSPAGSSPWG